MDAKNAVRYISRGRVYGLIASVLLIGYFVVPIIVDLAGRACAGPLICPANVETGVYGVLAVAAAISLLAGFLISREIGKYPTGSNGTAALIFAAMTAFFGGIVWVVLEAAFW